jgi:coenzyme F420-reducing hydrogenase delta subunit
MDKDNTSFNHLPQCPQYAKTIDIELKRVEPTHISSNKGKKFIQGSDKKKTKKVMSIKPPNPPNIAKL